MSESTIGGENTKGVNMKVKTTSSPFVKEFWSGSGFLSEIIWIWNHRNSSESVADALTDLVGLVSLYFVR